MSTHTRVVIVGGGFGGLTAARALAGVSGSVTLIDKSNFHLFQPLLYQVAIAGLSPAEIASPIRSILAGQANLRVLMGEVTGFDLKANTVQVGKERFEFDTLIVAAGARSSYFGHNDWEAHAPSLKTLEDAIEIRRRVLSAFEDAERENDPKERERLLTFAVIGGGPTGVELAGAIAELAKFVLNEEFKSIDPKDTKVILFEGGPRILPAFSESLSERAKEQLEELGVIVRTSTRVGAIDSEGITIELDRTVDDVPGLGYNRNERIEAKTVVWGAGVAASELGILLGSPCDKSGRVVVDSDCSIPNHPNVFVIGDLAHFDENGKTLPGLSPVAMQQARYVARIITRGIEKANREPFHYIDKGTMATIGRSRAIAAAGGQEMTGFIAWLAWLVVHIFYLIGFRNRFIVIFTWAWSYFSYKRGARLITRSGWASKAAAKEPLSAS